MTNDSGSNHRRSRLQKLALLLALASPFGLYLALQQDNLYGSLFFFILLAAGMLLTFMSG